MVSNGGWVGGKLINRADEMEESYVRQCPSFLEQRLVVAGV